MKKIIAVAVVICLLFAGVLAHQNGGIAAVENSSGYGDMYEAIYDLHSPDEIVMRVDGADVSWAEYFYSYYSAAGQVEQYMAYAPYIYGTEINWTDPIEEGETMTFADYPAEYALGSCEQIAGVNGFARALGIGLSEESLQTYDETVEAYVQSAGVSTPEEFFALLEENFANERVFENQVKTSLLQEQCFAELYGAEGEKVSDEEAVAFLEEGGYMRVMHILVMTGENREEEEALAQAEEIAAELAELEGEELTAKFAELAEQYNEDSNSEYTFTEGSMVEEFESAAKALGEYGVSEPVKSSYGYHVILRLPLDPDALTIEDGESGRLMAAEADFSSRFTEYMLGVESEFVNGFVPPVITDYLKYNEGSEAAY